MRLQLHPGGVNKSQCSLTLLEMCTCSTVYGIGIRYSVVEAQAELFPLGFGHVHYVTLHVTTRKGKHSRRRAAHTRNCTKSNRRAHICYLGKENKQSCTRLSDTQCVSHTYYSYVHKIYMLLKTSNT